MRQIYLIPGVFLVGRLFLLLSLPIESLVGFGDFWNFFGQAGLGLPFIDYWSEFPPGFPFLSTLIYEIAGGREYVYQISLIVVLSLIQAGALAVFIALSHILHPEREADRRAWVYAVFSLGLVFSWWYFDILAVLLLLLGLYWILSARFDRAALAAGIGALVKWFPLLLVVLPWRYSDQKTAVRFSVIVAAVVAIPLLILYALSPNFLITSIMAQISKGPWETIWALLSGNVRTGNFGPLIDRTDPTSLSSFSGASSVVPTWLTLLLFLGIGILLFLRVNDFSARSAVGFLGVTWCLFLLWSPGYSPQWVLYLLPLILLALPERVGILMSIVLIGVNLLEWPFLLSRGLFSSLWILIPVRMGLLALLAVEFWRPCRIRQVKEAQVDIPA